MSRKRMTEKEHYCLTRNPPMQIFLILFVWGRQTSHMVAYEMVLKNHQLAYFCTDLINAIVAKPKVTLGQTTLKNNSANMDWNCDYEKKKKNVILKR